MGFAGGNNVGIREALKRNYEYIMLLNNDTEIEKNCIGNLISGVTDNTITVPTILFYDYPDIIWYGGGYFDKSIGNCYHYNYKENLKYQKSHKTCDFATGCCIMFPSKVLQNELGFNESYFMYFEDAELSIRLLKSGYKIKYIPEARVYHKVGMSSGGEESPLSTYYTTRNRLFCIKENPDFFGRFTLLKAILSRYIRIIEYYLAGKKQWKYIYKGVKDFKKGIRGKVEIKN